MCTGTHRRLGAPSIYVCISQNYCCTIRAQSIQHHLKILKENIIIRILLRKVLVTFFYGDFKIKGFLVIHKCHKQRMIILCSLLYYLSNSMDVVHEAVGISKPSLLNGWNSLSLVARRFLTTFENSLWMLLRSLKNSTTTILDHMVSR